MMMMMECDVYIALEYPQVEMGTELLPNGFSVTSPWIRRGTSGSLRQLYHESESFRG